MIERLRYTSNKQLLQPVVEPYRRGEATRTSLRLYKERTSLALAFMDDTRFKQAAEGRSPDALPEDRI